MCAAIGVASVLQPIRAQSRACSAQGRAGTAHWEKREKRLVQYDNSPTSICLSPLEHRSDRFLVRPTGQNKPYIHFSQWKPKEMHPKMDTRNDQPAGGISSLRDLAEELREELAVPNGLGLADAWLSQIWICGGQNRFG